MKLAVVGAGSTYTPELVSRVSELPVTELALHDIDPDRLQISITEREPFALWQKDRRVSVIAVRLPPLRERREEIPRLVRHFLAKLGRPGAPVPEQAMEVMLSHGWPGNVRELRNFVERLVVLHDLDAATQLGGLGTGVAGAADAAGAALPVDLPYHEAKRAWGDQLERVYLARLLDRHGGNISEVARVAGLSRQTCYRLMQKHGLRGT